MRFLLIPRHHFLAAVALLWSLAVSCNSAGCVEECYETCDVFCDLFGCWEECYQECYCLDYAECYGDRDCARGEVCVGGECLLEPSGEQGLCEACTSHGSCIESDALCVTLPGSGERVCGRGCRQDADCPANFSCAPAGSSARQCIPTSGACNVVDAGCTATSQCGPDETCERGECLPTEG